MQLDKDHVYLSNISASQIYQTCVKQLKIRAILLSSFSKSISKCYHRYHGVVTMVTIAVRHHEGEDSSL